MDLYHALVILGWVLFRAESISDALVYLRSMFWLNGNSFTDGLFTGWLKQNAILLGIGFLLSTPVFRILSEKLKDNQFVSFVRVVGRILLLMLSVASLISSSYNPFIYFNF